MILTVVEGLEGLYAVIQIYCQGSILVALSNDSIIILFTSDDGALPFSLNFVILTDVPTWHVY